MTWSVGAPFMLWGLLGVSIPVIIHLLSRRRTETIDWGAMQFLDLGRRAQRKMQITELLLMVGRMALLGLVALAVARPFWQPPVSENGVTKALGGGRASRDTVIVLDGSESMDRTVDGESPRSQSLAWITTFAKGMKPGDSASLLLARDRVKPLTDGLTYDPARVGDALKSVPASRGSSDMTAAIAESFRVLESGKNPATDVVILTDGQRLPWRPGEPRRWTLLRDLRKELKGRAPRISSIAFPPKPTTEGADAAVVAIDTPRGVYSPNASIAVSATVTNAGPASASRSAELLIDGVGVPGTAQRLGPIPPGGKAPLVFRTTIANPGSHLLGVRLSGGDDLLAANDLAERPVEIAEALPVLLIDGEPGLEPLSGEVDFLRAALAPAEDEAPAVQARTVPASDLAAKSLEGRRVAVLANANRLDAAQVAALSRFVGDGGGLLVCLGDRVDDLFFNDTLFANGNGLLPAKLGEPRGDANRRQAIAHPAPRTFTGPALGPFGAGDTPALGEADLFLYRVLAPATTVPPSAVIARLDSGDPWAVERPYRKGRVILMAGPIDAEGGTLPVNPDFVPLVHELIYRLADPEGGNVPAKPGETVVVDLPEAPAPEVKTADVTRPDGTTSPAPLVRESGKVRVRIDDPGEPGIYRVRLPGPSGGTAFASVASDARETETEPLAPAESAALAEGWPLAFATQAEALDTRLRESSGGGPRPLWRWLVLAALGGLCLEVFLTRSMVRSRGVAPQIQEPGA